jgi:predicted HicB family RNase H-like nuclease
MTESPNPSKRSGKVAHLRLPDDLHAQLTEYAQRNDRSLNSAAVFLLRQALADQPTDS